MKSITAYVQPFMLEKVVDALRARKTHGVTVLQCQGFGHRIDGKTPHYSETGTLQATPTVAEACRQDRLSRLSGDSHYAILFVIVL